MAIFHHHTTMTYFVKGGVRSYHKVQWNRISKDQDAIDHERDILITKLCHYYSRHRMKSLKALIGLDYDEAEAIIMGYGQFK